MNSHMKKLKLPIHTLARAPNFPEVHTKYLTLDL